MFLVTVFSLCRMLISPMSHVKYKKNDNFALPILGEIAPYRRALGRNKKRVGSGVTKEACANTLGLDHGLPRFSCPPWPEQIPLDLITFAQCLVAHWPLPPEEIDHRHCVGPSPTCAVRRLRPEGGPGDTTRQALISVQQPYNTLQVKGRFHETMKINKTIHRRIKIRRWLFKTCRHRWMYWRRSGGRLLSYILSAVGEVAFFVKSTVQ